MQLLFRTKRTYYQSVETCYMPSRRHCHGKLANITTVYSYSQTSSYCNLWRFPFVFRKSFSLRNVYPQNCSLPRLRVTYWLLRINWTFKRHAYELGKRKFSLNLGNIPRSHRNDQAYIQWHSVIWSVSMNRRKETWILRHLTGFGSGYQKHRIFNS